MAGLARGTFVGNYRIVSKLGEGAMGQVFLGEHPVIGSKAAIKVLAAHLSADQAMARRFIAEAKAANRIEHPNIIKVFDFGKLPDSRLYLGMEFLKGRDLAAYLEANGALPLDAAREMFVQIAGAMAAAHEAGIVHRDLKPSNIFLQETGKRLVVKILDFGIAKLLDETERDGAGTRTGTVLGTPYYMAPEQAKGEVSAITPRTDVYALGIILYQMLSGRLPITGETAIQILMAHLSQPPIPLQTVAPGLPAGLYEIVSRALEKDPADRFAYAGDLLEAFEGLFQDPAAATELSQRAPGALPGPIREALASDPFGSTVSPAVVEASGPVGPGESSGGSRGAATGPEPRPSMRSTRSTVLMALAGLVVGVLVLVAGYFWIRPNGAANHARQKADYAPKRADSERKAPDRTRLSEQNDSMAPRPGGDEQAGDRVVGRLGTHGGDVPARTRAGHPIDGNRPADRQTAGRSAPRPARGGRHRARSTRGATARSRPRARPARLARPRSTGEDDVMDLPEK